MTNKDSVVRVGVIGPGGAGRGNTLAFATADNNEQSLDALEKGLREQVENYQENSFKRYISKYEFKDTQCQQKYQLSVIMRRRLNYENC